MARKEVGYVPGPDFKEDRRPALFDFQMNENTELWLVQLPDDHFPDFETQDITLDLDQDGEIGSLKGSDGKVYSIVNFPADVAETTVFQPSESGTKIVGKVSRHVSLVHFPEPEELIAQQVDTKKTPMTSKTTYTRSRFSTPPPSTGHKTQSRSKSQSIHGSRQVSKGSGSERSMKSGLTQDSGRGHTSITISGSSEQSQRKKSKTKM